MLRILHNTNYDFLRHWRAAAAISAAFILLGAGLLIFGGGVRYSIDFTGGTLMQLEFEQPPDVAQIRGALDQAGIGGAEIQSFGSNREFTVRAQEEEQIASQAAGASGVARRIEDVLTETIGANSYAVVRTEAVSARVGSELRLDAALAVILSFAITLVYMAWRFDSRFGFASIAGTIHDVFTTITFIRLFNFEISLTVIAAILTVIGYSLNDKIVVFDRARENLYKYPRETLYETLNRAVNETLPRSVLTHATTFAATLSLLLFAGDVIRPFAAIMTFGIVTGAFSSIYVGPALLLWVERRYPRTGVQGSRAAAGPGARPAGKVDSRPRANRA